MVVDRADQDVEATGTHRGRRSRRHRCTVLEREPALPRVPGGTQNSPTGPHYIKATEPGQREGTFHEQHTIRGPQRHRHRGGIRHRPGAALLFAEEGAKVLVADLNQDGAEETVKTIKAAGGNAVSVAGDLSDPQVVNEVVTTALQSFGSLDVLVNNAGIMDSMAALADVDDAEWPAGRWVHQQRKSLRAGELEERRKTLLDAPEAGMVWEPGEEAWENKLAAFRSYRKATGHLAPRQDAVWGEIEAAGLVPIGQHLANLRRKGGLGKDPDRAEKRAAQLTAIDEDWDCPWPLNWQRHYRVLADLVDADGVLPYIAPGVTFDGDDIGTWRWAQQNAGVQAQLMPGQRERLAALGIPVAEPAPPAPAAPRTTKTKTKGPGRAQAAFQRGLAALTQWVEQEGDRPVPRGAVVEVAVDGEAEPAQVKLGVGISNTKARRDKLTPEQLDALRELGMDWAAVG
ncbi:hypothetical protein SMICM304S_09979 [Streptomyces microflavus]